MIEKHLTLDRRMAGPDHHASATPQEFVELVERIRAVESMLGRDFEMLVHLDPKAQAATAEKAHLDQDAYLVRRV